MNSNNPIKKQLMPLGIPLVLVFFTVALIGILNHEMWEDELQAWMLARDSASIINLYQNMRYEGHPALWHLGLFLMTRFTHNPLFMQLYHLLIATTSVYIIDKYSPFTNQQKWLLAFGCFPLYEYCIISRNYALGMLFIFVFCALFPYRHKGYLSLSLVLLLLANTNIYGLIIAITLGLSLVYDRLLEQPKKPLRKWDIILSTFIFMAGIIISLVQIIPPADSGYAVGWYTRLDFDRLTQTLHTILRSYIPIPLVWKFDFWAIIPVFLIISGVGLFWRKPVVLFMYTCSTLGILLFTYAKLLGYLRHHGHLLIIFIACVWISHYYQESNIWTVPKLMTKNFKTYYKVLFRVILYANLIAGILSLYRDIVYPFSEGKAVANFIRQQNLYSIPIIGSIDAPASTQAGYLDRKIYYTESDSLGTFIILNNKRKELNTREVIEKVQKFVSQRSQDTLLVLNHLPNENKDEEFISLVPQYFYSDYIVSTLKHFDGSIQPNENFTLYLIKHK